jgi:beta-amylase/aarF domain-containing kinase
MPPDATSAIIRRELGVKDLAEVFDWIDLAAPLGSASIAQVWAGWRVHHVIKE